MRTCASIVRDSGGVLNIGPAARKSKNANSIVRPSWLNSLTCDNATGSTADSNRDGTFRLSRPARQAPTTVGMVRSTEDWLRRLSDAELTELLTARPDVLMPAPPDFATLARRLDSAATVRRAVAGRTAFELQILHAAWALETAAPTKPASTGLADPDTLAAFLGGPATADDVDRAARHLSATGLLRRSEHGFRLGPTTADALGRYPGGLGASTGLAKEDVMARLATSNDTELALLRRLVPGPPIGSAPPGSPGHATAEALVDRGLLTPLADGTVALPREVALALRGPQPLGPAVADPPPLAITQHRPGTVDGAAGGRALAAHDTAVKLLTALGENGLPALKSGGIGIVAVRRLARDLDVEIPIVALYLELLHALGMIAPALTRGHAAATWLPTQIADTFLAGAPQSGWALIASAWLDLRRDASRVGEHDAADKVIGALSVQSDWRRGPADRRRVLRQILSLGVDQSASRDSIVARLHFAAPMANPATLTALTQSVLDEATELGVVAFDAMSTPGRAILAGEIEDVAGVLESILPRPVESVMVQADMTIIAPGRLTPSLAAALAEVADVESAGSATVYRLSEASVRRALDAGATSAELHRLLTQHSSTPVPQSVTYLIDDVARRHGVLRAGAVGSVLHSDDASLVAQAVAAVGAAGLPIRTLAPTVAVSGVDLETLMEALRAAGLDAAPEDARGEALSLAAPPRRTRAAIPSRIAYTEPSAPTEAQLDAMIRRMRAADRSLGRSAGDVAQDGAPWSAASGPMATGDIVSLLREAAHARRAVWVRYADAEGGTSARVVEPIVVSGGTMVAYDKLRDAPRTFVLSRISSAEPDL